MSTDNLLVSNLIKSININEEVADYLKLYEEKQDMLKNVLLI
jgi:hypothetical protein